MALRCLVVRRELRRTNFCGDVLGGCRCDADIDRVVVRFRARLRGDVPRVFRPD